MNSLPSRLADAIRLLSFVPTGQPENSPAFQRRVIVSIGMSPIGTADWTAQGFRRCQSYHFEKIGRPCGTWNV
jgi:hypothetical protein